MPKCVRNKGFASLVIVLIAVILIALGGSVTYILTVGNEVSSSSNTKSLIPIKTATPLSKPISSLKSKYILERRTRNGTEELFTVSNTALFRILRWNNLIIFSDGDQDDNNDPPRIQIQAHDIDTGKTDIVFDNLESGAQFNDTKKQPNFLSDLKIIDNTLYFSLGGYFREGAVFWLNLPPSKKPQKIITSRNASVDKLRDWYFIIGGEGDSCWGEREFYLLDTKIKVAKKVTGSKIGCNTGEESLGLTKDGRMIMAYHGTAGDDPYQGDYEYVATIDIFNPNIKSTIISREQMPPKINRMLYSEERDQLLMIGSGLYLYDFTEDKLNKIADSPAGVKLYSAETNWVQDKVCLDGEKGSTYNKYELNLSLKKITQLKLTCNIVSSPTPETKTDFKELVNSFNLPSNYQLIVK